MVAKTERRATLDTSVWVNYFTGGGAADPDWWLTHSENVIRHGFHGDFRIVVPAIVIAEVAGTGAIRGSHLKSGDRVARVKRVREWLSNPSIWLSMELDERNARLAAELAIEHQLRGGDAVVLASAVISKSEALASWDDDLLKLDGAFPGMSICTPEVLASQHADLLDTMGEDDGEAEDDSEFR